MTTKFLRVLLVSPVTDRPVGLATQEGLVELGLVVAVEDEDPTVLLLLIPKDAAALEVLISTPQVICCPTMPIMEAPGDKPVEHLISVVTPTTTFAA